MECMFSFGKNYSSRLQPYTTFTYKPGQCCGMFNSSITGVFMKDLLLQLQFHSHHCKNTEMFEFMDRYVCLTGLFLQEVCFYNWGSPWCAPIWYNFIGFIFFILSCERFRQLAIYSKKMTTSLLNLKNTLRTCDLLSFSKYFCNWE